MYTLNNLPSSTFVGREISKDKMFLYVFDTSKLRTAYTDQFERIVWRNKLSAETFPIKSGSQFSELEIFDLSLKNRTVDKRLLRKIDTGIPYYIFHILKFDNMYQAWIAEKTSHNGKIRVENYTRTLWLHDNELSFDFCGRTVNDLYANLKSQIEAKRNIKIDKVEQLEACNSFMRYFRTTRMARSYKPVLILATLQSGGVIPVDKAAEFFVNFYQNRKRNGLIPEFGSCVYADSPDDIVGIRNNLIQNPIKALCNSGFFKFDSKNKLFSFADGIYDSLSFAEIDELTAVCMMRLNEYYREYRK